MTEETDAIVILVSEEAGEAHLVKNGKITTNLNEPELRQSLAALLDISRKQDSLPRRIRRWFLEAQVKNKRGRIKSED
jgi:hypothetical protein